LCQAGFRVTFLERRGCGLNRAARGDAPSFRRLLDDIAEFVLSSRRLETVPTILLGHSWGGNLGIALQRRRKGLMEGLILVCPELFPRLRCSGGPPSLNYTLSRLLAPRRLLPIPFSAPELLTASPYWQEYLREDPLYLRQATARHLAAYARVNRYARGATRHLTVPVMLLLAEQDQFIDNARTRRFVQGLPAEYKHIGEVPSAQHTLAFEPEPNEYLDACISWMGWTYGV
jgi:alpha-beta hydrolase superfamily lysophospholipase